MIDYGRLDVQQLGLRDHPEFAPKESTCPPLLEGMTHSDFLCECHHGQQPTDWPNSGKRGLQVLLHRRTPAREVLPKVSQRIWRVSKQISKT